jgi:hypothetical protein
LGDVEIHQGDCLSSLAFHGGLFWETVWNHPRNAALNDLRKDPFTLAPGDVVYVPARRIKIEGAETGRMHRYLRRGVPARLKIVLQDHLGKPLGNLDYTLDIDSRKVTGKTTGEGLVEQWINPNAAEGRLSFDAPDYGHQQLTLKLGHLLPISEVTGVQSRLHNLGYYAGPADGQMSPAVAAALQDFQVGASLPPTGKLDPQTRALLFSSHDS